jgi:serine/threonine protein phosphatase PrpC
VGRRQRQEDSFSVNSIDLPHGREADIAQLFIVADGMGGHAGGDVASQSAVDAFSRSFKASTVFSETWLVDALMDANKRIAQEISLDTTLAGMGTTFLGALRRGNELDWVSVGDSLLLLFRDGTLRRLNEDHSMLPRLIEAAQAIGRDVEEAYRDRRRHQLRSALDGRKPELIDRANCELRPGDLVMLASDGIQTLSMNELAALLEQNRNSTTDQLVDLLIATIEQRNTPQQDNVTLIVYRHS